MRAEIHVAVKRYVTFFNLLKQNPLRAISSQIDAAITTTKKEPNSDPDVISDADSTAVFGTNNCDRTLAHQNGGKLKSVSPTVRRIVLGLILRKPKLSIRLSLSWCK